MAEDYTIVSQGESADGSLRWEERIGPLVGGRYDPASPWFVLIDATTGAVLVDGESWISSITQADGIIFVHVAQNGFETLFRIEPVLRRFRNAGERGPDRPLPELPAAVEEARAITMHRAPPFYRRVAPDGTARVDLDTVEWSNSHWVNSPRVIDLADGRVVLDLWGSDWDAAVSFPGERRVRLGFRRYHQGASLAAEIDLSRDTYRIVSELGHEGPLPEAPLRDIASGLEESAQRVVRAASINPSVFTHGHAPTAIHPLAAWRWALLILVGALLLIAVATYLTMRLSPEPKQLLTPLPPMPSANRSGL
jgi:hypothetical protein